MKWIGEIVYTISKKFYELVSDKAPCGYLVSISRFDMEMQLTSNSAPYLDWIERNFILTLCFV